RSQATIVVLAVMPQTFDEIKKILSANCRKQRVQLSRTYAPKKVGRLLNQFSKRVNSLKLERSGWAAIGLGIKRRYRDGRRGYRLAQQTGSPEHFHEWRKRVKDLFYQAGLLCPIWPEQVNTVEDALKHLGELLGDSGEGRVINCSFISQSHHRIDFRGATSRDIACQQGHDAK